MDTMDAFIQMSMKVFRYTIKITERMYTTILGWYTMITTII